MTVKLFDTRTPSPFSLTVFWTRAQETFFFIIISTILSFVSAVLFCFLNFSVTVDAPANISRLALTCQVQNGCRRLTSWRLGHFFFSHFSSSFSYFLPKIIFLMFILLKRVRLNPEVDLYNVLHQSYLYSECKDYVGGNAIMSKSSIVFTFKFSHLKCISEKINETYSKRIKIKEESLTLMFLKTF